MYTLRNRLRSIKIGMAHYAKEGVKPFFWNIATYNANSYMHEYNEQGGSA